MVTLLSKIYDGETIIDVDEDITDAVNSSSLPVDEYGFVDGEFVVTVKFIPRTYDAVDET